jgi:hypothetical protein
MNDLFSCLATEGFSTNQLFLSVCKGVLDPGNYKETGPEQNLAGFLESKRLLEPTTYLAYTKLVPVSPSDVSGNLLRKWSSFRLQRVEEFRNQQTTAVCVGNEPFIVTRKTVVGGIGEIHRREAQHVYSLRLQRHPELSVYVLPLRSYFKADVADAPEEYHDVGFEQAGLDLRTGGDGPGALFFQRASRDLFDFPDEAIRNLLVGAELRWRKADPDDKHTDDVLADAYRWSLRKRLHRDIDDYLARVYSIGRTYPLPSGSAAALVASQDWKANGDFRELLEEVQSLDDNDDELLALRLREVQNWYRDRCDSTSELSGKLNTWHEINDLMKLIRGVRNSATHFEPPGQELYGVMLYLAKVLFEAFAAACMRDHTTAVTGEG